MDFTWADLLDPAAMAAITLVLMTILFKPLIRLVMRAIKPEAPEDWPLEALIINIVTIVVVFFTGYFRLEQTFTGDLYVLTVMASGICILGYEGTKNLLATRGIDISKIGLLFTKVGAK